MRKLTLFLASNAGLGYAPFASGTVGTLAGIPVFYLTAAWPWWLYMITMTALLFLSFWVADAAGRAPLPPAICLRMISEFRATV